ncbi:hypothetical protein ACJ72_08831 [Emergomyces africanus]|uniref:Uncharacterized protein n=1 Tax=Emergomyces africanus TaxID=1955775 RepID=A0A1B7NJQ0_9EURO|nr:hypothetical protein ACJ72_08831 [Emergomyces africanus]
MLTASDLFPSQKIDNYQPLNIIEKNNELEYKIKSIIHHRHRRQYQEYLIK